MHATFTRAGCGGWKTALLVIGLSQATLVGAAGDNLPEAARNRDASTIARLLSQGAGVDEREPDGATALHWAVYWHDVDTADRLIRAGAKVNLANDLGITPLFLASSQEDATLATRLLDAGADANKATLSGETPLMEAARTGRVDVTRALLAHGAQVNASETTHDQTALMWAAVSGHPDVVRALIEAGADVHARSQTRIRKVILSSNRQASYDLGTYERLLKTGGMVEVQEGGYTALLFTAQQGNVESAKILLGAGADVNDTAPIGMSALVVAAYSDHAGMGQLLLEEGADPDAAGAGYTALHAAILRGNLEFVEALLAHGANPNLPLTKANGARRQSADYAFGDTLVGATPIYLAAKFAEIPIMRALAAAGADLRFTMPDGTTPMMAALDLPKTDSGNVEGLGRDRRDRYVFFRRIKTESPDDFTPKSPEEAERDALAMVTMEVNAGVDVNAANSDGDTALHFAAFEGLNSVIQFLVDHGANVNARNGRNQTPVDMAEAPRSNRGGDPLPIKADSAALLRTLGGEEGGVKLDERIYRRQR